MKNTNEEILDQIFDSSMINPDITDAKAYGINFDEEGKASSTFLDFNPDVYRLIDDLRANTQIHSFEYISLLTTGWAAPLNSHGEIEGAPSEHPERRRVTLVIGINVADKSPFGSVLEFEDDTARVYDFNQATGMLADATSTLFYN